MAPALAILRRDLVRMARSPVRTALLFAVPLLLAAIMALAFGGGSGPSITMTVLVWDEDQTLLTGLLKGASDADPRLELRWVEGEEGHTAMEAGEASALLHIPAGFTADYLAGRPTVLELVQNPAERFLPRVAEEGAHLGTVMLDAISRVFRDQLDVMADLLGAEETPEPARVAALAAGVTATIDTLEPYLFPPLIELETVSLTRDAEDREAAGSGAGFDVLDAVFPGLAVLGVLFLAQAATRDIIRERQSGLLRHLLTAPVSVADYLAGKCLSVVTVTLLGFSLLVAVGAAVGVAWGPPAIVAALVAVTALAAGGLLLVIASLGTSETAQDTVSTLVILIGSLIGGSLVPLSQIPAFMRPFSRLSLNYWTVDAFDALIRRGGGWTEVAPNLALLGVLGIGLLALGAALLGRRMSSGAV